MLSDTDLHTELTHIENLKQRWLMGDAAPLLSHPLPDSWQGVLSGLPEDRHALAALALASQYVALQLPQLAEDAQRNLPALPVLPLPLLSDDNRFRFRHIAAAFKHHVSALLTLIVARGFVVHPNDWLPQGNEPALPEIYAPWVAWCHHQSVDTVSAPLLNEDNWHDWMPAQRVAALRQLRQRAPAEARSLIESCALSETAEKRFMLVEILGIGLSDDDQPLLESLQRDRSKKIQGLVTQLLRRIGVSANPQSEAELAAELAECYQFKKSGVFSKSVLLPLKLKNNTQRARRYELLSTVSLAHFAQHLDIELTELLTCWPFKVQSEDENLAFVANAAASLPMALLMQLQPQVLDSVNHFNNAVYGSEILALLCPRLSLEQRQDLALALLDSGISDVSFALIQETFACPLPLLDWSSLSRCQPWRLLVAALKRSLADGGYLDSNDRPVFELHALGLLLSRECAIQVVASLSAQGVMAADPALNTLKLNIALTPHCESDQGLPL